MDIDSTPPLITERTLIGAALAVAPAAIGCGIGVLIGHSLKKGNREGVALALFALGAVAAVPATIDYVKRAVNAPKTTRGSNRTLKAIRHGDVAYDDAYGSIIDDHVEEFLQHEA